MDKWVGVQLLLQARENPSGVEASIPVEITPFVMPPFVMLLYHEVGRTSREAS
jgi:hypothetical protein